MRVVRSIPARGFSLIEAIIVVVIIGILAASAAPMIGSQGELRERAAATEVGASLQTARAFAMATGDPCGLRVRVTAESIELVTWNTETQQREPLADLAGAPAVEMAFAEHFPGVHLARATDGQGDADEVVVWFGHDGAPQWRESNGTLIGIAEADAEIEFGEGTLVRVLAVSGAIE